MFHTHIWKEKLRTQTTPMNSIKGLTSVSEYFLERIVLGVTTILWECEVCQKLRKEELLGKVKIG